ncbi:MAG: hydroxyacid dehydrogenase, partial [Conexibacter sp.]|nr:hydroxyacid dehydrogenase [Conexibacter sp.]
MTPKRVETESLVCTSALCTRKARDIAANPHVALLFRWPSLGGQVHVTRRGTRGSSGVGRELFDERDVVSFRGAAIDDLAPVRDRLAHLTGVAETAGLGRARAGAPRGGALGGSAVGSATTRKQPPLMVVLAQHTQIVGCRQFAYAAGVPFPPKVIVLLAAGEPMPAALAAAAPLAELVAVDNEAGLVAELPLARALLHWDFRSDLLRRGHRHALEWIHTASLGVDAVLTQELADSAVVVTNARGVYERAIAEYVLALLLAFAKDLPRTVELQRQRAWRQRPTTLIAGRRVLVAGAGGIGREAALLLRAAGMHVEVLGRHGRDDP